MPPALNARACAALGRAGGADAEVVETVGRHGYPSNVDPPRVVAFFDGLC